MGTVLTFYPRRVIYGVLDLSLWVGEILRLELPTVSSMSSQRREYRGLDNWGDGRQKIHVRRHHGPSLPSTRQSVHQICDWDHSPAFRRVSRSSSPQFYLRRFVQNNPSWDVHHRQFWYLEACSYVSWSTLCSRALKKKKKKKTVQALQLLICGGNGLLEWLASIEIGHQVASIDWPQSTQAVVWLVTIRWAVEATRPVWPGVLLR